MISNILWVTLFLDVTKYKRLGQKYTMAQLNAYYNVLVTQCS